jgi:hypothetical protein
MCFVTASWERGRRWGAGEARLGACTVLRWSLDLGATRMAKLWLDLRVR